MLGKLNESERRIATRLIKGAIAMAKITLGRFLQSSFIIKKIVYGNSEDRKGIFVTNKEVVYIIKTELIGQLGGSGYLILSEKEVNSIFKACLPPNLINDDSTNGNLMKEGFLTEVHNMVASSVITEFAEFLGLDLFGGVPKVKIMQGNMAEAFIKESSQENATVHFKACLQGEELDIMPDFIWVFENKFIDLIKESA